MSMGGVTNNFILDERWHVTLNKALWGHQMELIVEGVVHNKLANTHKQTHTHEHILRATAII